MAQGHKIIAIVNHWKKYLSPRDAEYFRDPGVTKDLSLFGALLKANDVHIEEEPLLEVLLLNYLQVLMLFCIVSEDYRDLGLARNFFHVPVRLEEISRKIRRPEDDFAFLEKKWRLRQEGHIENLYNSSAKDTLDIIRNCPPSHSQIVDEILSYYSTPVVAFCCICGMSVAEYSFRQELSGLLEYVMSVHFPAYESVDENIDHYIEGMLIVSRSGKKAA